ncbi:hypothetical protein J4N46_08090 [Capnocytophaga sp. Marseille-Q4570]|uniref:Immunity protein 45 domain-containing protein n=1 Tax=Capnocytophaga bilenii TaxID=2819369 RepID=A0ABS3PYS1_9FLAO|nr:hypothetical protein [Capnocytophaga bilenii]MBO1884382.1 hypothetical protein [Capnocytophaga bilenii]
MNKLKINVVTLKEDEYLIRDSIRFENFSYLQLLIDYEDIATYPDFEDMLIVPSELCKSSLQTGEYLLFTCACGVADDGGWSKIKVTHSEAIVQWDFLRGKPYCFKFSKENYLKEIQIINKKSYTFIPKEIIFPEI